MLSLNKSYKNRKVALIFTANTNILILLYRELKTDGKSFIFAVCRLPLTSSLTSQIIKFLPRSVGGKHLMHFQSENSVFKFLQRSVHEAFTGAKAFTTVQSAELIRSPRSQGQCVVFLSKTLYSRNASLLPGV